MNKYKFSAQRRGEIAATKRSLLERHPINVSADQPVFRAPAGRARRYEDLVRYAIAMGRKQDLLPVNLSEWHATATWHTEPEGTATVDFQQWADVSRRSWEPDYRLYGPIIQVHLRFLDWDPAPPVEEVEGIVIATLPDTGGALICF